MGHLLQPDPKGQERPELEHYAEESSSKIKGYHLGTDGGLLLSISVTRALPGLVLWVKSYFWLMLWKNKPSREKMKGPFQYSSCTKLDKHPLSICMHWGERKLPWGHVCIKDFNLQSSYFPMNEIAFPDWLQNITFSRVESILGEASFQGEKYHWLCFSLLSARVIGGCFCGC